MDVWITSGLVFAGVVVSGIVTYLIARRTSSGNISTSDAASLWKESNSLRQEYRERAEKLEEQLTEVNNKLEAVMQELTTLRANTTGMEEKIKALQKIIADLQNENKRLLAQKGQQSS